MYSTDKKLEPDNSKGPGKASVVRSVKHAWEGVLFCLETQRHMRIHFTIVALVLLAAWTLGMDLIPFLHLFAAMAVVLVAEMFNTALEATVELVVQGYDTRAKVVKDVAAGAVLIASAYAITVAVLVFSTTPRVVAVFANLSEVPPAPPLNVMQVVATGAILLGIFIIWLKRATGRGSFWRGGVISGHSALGFLAAVAIMLATHDLAIMLLALALAALLTQSRIQARIHTVAEALLGSLAGALVAFLLFIWQFN